MLVIFRRLVAARGGYMRQFSAARCLAALISLGSLVWISGCGGAPAVGTPTAASIVLSPSTLSVNEGQVVTLTATALDYNGNTVVVDMTFSSSNPALASVSSGGLVCGGQFDSGNIVCTANGDGIATITVTSGSVSASAPVYVHKQVDRVVINPMSGCESSSTLLSPSASAYNTTAPGCSVSAPCDITSTVGPFTFGSGNLDVVANAAGIASNYSSATNSPTYSSGGTITGSKDQTCNLTGFSVGGGTGINPTYDPAKNTPTYVSGGSITGTAGQTCNLTAFNGITGATALVTLTDTNVIPSGARLIITAQGFGGGSVAPTTATLSNGTATCNGTANVMTSLLTTTGVNPVIGATATVNLTGSNTIATGTHLTITNEGYGAVQPPTTATLSNGTATCSGTASVVTALNAATGLEAQTPGSTVLFASVAGVNSVGTPFTTCPVTSIQVHDANGSATNFTLSGGQAQNLVADVLDSKGATIKPNLNWGTTQPGAISMSSDAATASIAGAGPGTSTVTATCVTPNCNINLAPQYSSDVVTATVAGQSPDTVYVASTQSLTMVPINVLTNVVGTAITLPNLPNSILASPTGGVVYLGADTGGVMVYTVSSASFTRLSFNGKVLALSPDATYLVVYDKSVNGIYFYDTSSQVILETAYGAGLAAAITPDSEWALSLANQQLIRQGNSVTQTTTNLGYTPNGLDLLAQGSLAFITSSGNHAVDVRSTCDQSDLQTLSANNPTLVKGLPNGNGAVVVDSPQIDLITTPQPTGTCPVIASSTLTSYDLQAGTFTPSQLIVSYDSTRAWILSNLASVLSFNISTPTPTSISLAGGAQPVSAALTLDSSSLYVGASDFNVHLISASSLSDTQQLVPGLKDANSNSVAPDLIAVLPR
jgi:trimeric autotransporter adhesin